MPIDDPDLAYWLEMSEAVATRDYLLAGKERADAQLGVQLTEIGGAVAFALTGIDNPFFNRVVGLGVARPATAEDVAAASAFYRRLERTWQCVHVTETARPAELPHWVEAEGFAMSRRWPKLWRRLDDELPQPKTSLRIERIGPAHADAFERIVMTAFEFPGELGPVASGIVGRRDWTTYLGFDGETPVSAAALYVTDGIGWLGFGATLASHRGRGGQSALFAQRLADARDAGCRFAITETGPDTPEEPNPSYRNMLRAGFEVAYFRPNYVKRPAAS